MTTTGQEGSFTGTRVEKEKMVDDPRNWEKVENKEKRTVDPGQRCFQQLIWIHALEFRGRAGFLFAIFSKNLDQNIKLCPEIHEF